MKKLVFLLAVVLSTLPLFSQDVIIKTNNETINCKVLGVKNKTLEYQLAGSSEVLAIPLKEVKSFKTTKGGSSTTANTTTSSVTNYSTNTNVSAQNNNSEEVIESSMKDNQNKSYYTGSSKGQSVLEKRFRIGVKGGLNMSSMSNNISNTYIAGEDYTEGMDYSLSYQAGFHAGIVAQIDLGSNFFIQPELLYSMQNIKSKNRFYGTETDGQSDYAYSASISQKTSLQYIQLPIYAGYKVNMGPGSKLIFGVGPYIAYGISGESKFTGEDDVELDGLLSGKLDTFGKDGYMNQFDFGLSALAGVQFNNKIQVTIGYDFGLANTIDKSKINKWNDDYEDINSFFPTTSNNRNFKASVAFFF